MTPATAFQADRRTDAGDLIDRFDHFRGLEVVSIETPASPF